MYLEIANNIKWVGKIDPLLRKFHGESLSTAHGSSFNSYLIEDDSTAVIDTVWTPYAGEFAENLRHTTDLRKIKYIIALHGEPDHSGALPALMELTPDAEIICTANGIKSLSGYYHKPWKFRAVKTGDRLSLGKRTLTFIDAPMLHWPDTMMCWLETEKILFSSDIFGQHYASDYLYDDKVHPDELQFEAMKYYANIIHPFTDKVAKKLAEMEKLGIVPSLICPAHGVIRRSGSTKAIEDYRLWSNNYSEDQITVVYDTMYNSTRMLAESIRDGIGEVNPGIKVKLYNASESDTSDIITEIFRSKAVLIGSPNVNGGLLHAIEALLDEMRTIGFGGKKAASFGSYGWSPLHTKNIAERLVAAGFEIIRDGLKVQWCPDYNALCLGREFGRDVANALL